MNSLTLEVKQLQKQVESSRIMNQLLCKNVQSNLVELKREQQQVRQCVCEQITQTAQVLDENKQQVLARTGTPVKETTLHMKSLLEKMEDLLAMEI